MVPFFLYLGSKCLSSKIVLRISCRIQNASVQKTFISVTFKKTGLQDFKGLLIEARKAKNPHQNVQLGTYNVGNSNLKLLQCAPNHNVSVPNPFVKLFAELYF